MSQVNDAITVAENCASGHDRHWVKYYEKDGVCLDHFLKGKIDNWVKWSDWSLNEVNFSEHPMWLNVYPKYEDGKTHLIMTLLPTKFKGASATQVHVKRGDLGFYAKVGQPMLGKFFAFDLNGIPGHRVRIVDLNMVSISGKYTFEASYLHKNIGAPGLIDDADVRVYNDVAFLSNGQEFVANSDMFILTAYEPSNGHVYIEATDADGRMYHSNAKKIHYRGVGFTNFYPKGVEDTWKEQSRPYGGRLIGWGSYYVEKGEAHVDFTTPPAIREVDLNLRAETPVDIAGGILYEGKLTSDGAIKGKLLSGIER